MCETPGGHRLKKFDTQIKREEGNSVPEESGAIGHPGGLSSVWQISKQVWKEIQNDDGNDL